MKVNELYVRYFKIFGIYKYQMRFSTHAPEKLGQKYINNPEMWKQTEDMVRKVLVKSGLPFVEVADEAAFYGPKIDIQIWSAIGREFTIATNQVDFAQAERFDLSFTNENNQKERPIIIHRAPLSTHERFIGFLLEHYAGKFPVWLAPEQVAVLPISDKYLDYAKEVQTELRKNGLEATLDQRPEKIGKKIPKQICNVILNEFTRRRVQIFQSFSASQEVRMTGTKMQNFCAICITRSKKMN